MIVEGADVVEVGGESTRPGATPVLASEETKRVVPVIREIVARWPSVRVAIDTVKHDVAVAALDAGATIVNDVSGLRLDPSIAELCARYNATLILMHSRGGVADMASFVHAHYEPAGVVESVVAELADSSGRAVAAGMDPERIVVDPGLGFSKRTEHSVRVLANLPRLLDLGFQVMVGASRKRFIGELTDVKNPSERAAGTIGANVVALTLGASWFRVHDVADNRHALDAARGILEARA